MKRIILTLIFSIAVLLAAIHISPSSAAEQPSFFGSSGTASVLSNAQDIPANLRTYWGASCSNAKYKAYTIDSGGAGSTGSFEECVHFANYGQMSTQGVKLGGSDVAYGIRGPQGTRINPYPIQGSNDLVFFENAGGTGGAYYTYIYTDFPNNFTPETSIMTGKPSYYKLTKDPFVAENITKNPDGTNSFIRDGSLGYSSDGKFIVGNSGAYQTIINTTTKQARLFGESTLVPGENPNARVAVTSSGSAALVVDVKANTYKLYNLNNCSAGATLSHPEACEKNDITSQIVAGIPGLRMVTQASFISDQIIEVFASVYTPTGTQTSKYYVLASGAQLQNFEYLGLGDSFASGEGVFNYRANTDVAGNKCHLSLDSYPYLLKTTLGFNTAQSVACSGAKVKDIIQVGKANYQDEVPQASGMVDQTYNEQILSNFLPGYRRQHEFIDRYRPAVVTLSVGGNDIDFAKKLSWCVAAPNSCYGTLEKRAGILKEIKAQFDKLIKTYLTFKAASPSVRLYVVGYPNIAKPGGDCAINVRLSNEEMELSEAIIADLNTVIKTATQKTGVFYVDASEAFAGHKMCETSSWDIAVNGLTAGNDLLPLIGYPLGKESYHPNKLGHTLYQTAILTQTNNLTAPMPSPDNTATIDAMPSLLVPQSTLALQSVAQPFNTDSIAMDKLVKGTSLTNVTADVDTFLKAGSTFAVELHSDPITIGTATVTGPQQLSINATIPADTEPGGHTIHIFGNNVAGEPIDIYKEVFIVASDEDYDGDGILDAQDTCSFVPPANQDTDKDNIDDACDPVISQPPAPPIDPTPPPDVPPITPPPAPELNVVQIIKTIVKCIVKILSFFTRTLRSLFR